MSQSPSSAHPSIIIHTSPILRPSIPPSSLHHPSTVITIIITVREISFETFYLPWKRASVRTEVASEAPFHFQAESSRLGMRPFEPDLATLSTDRLAFPLSFATSRIFLSQLIRGTMEPDHPSLRPLANNATERV